MRTTGLMLTVLSCLSCLIVIATTTTQADGQPTVPRALIEYTAPMSAYLADVIRRCKRSWRPSKAIPSKTPLVYLRINHAGKLISIKLQRSSGDQTVDEEIIKSVASAAPFRPLPSEAPDYVDLELGFYNQRRSEIENSMFSQVLKELSITESTPSISIESSSLRQQAPYIYVHILNKIRGYLAQNAALCKGIAYYSQEKYENAIEEFTKAIEQFDLSAAPYSWRASAYVKLGFFRQAFRDYARAIDFDLQDLHCSATYPSVEAEHKSIIDEGRIATANDFRFRGNLYLHSKLFQQAVNDYSNSLALCPNIPATYYCRAIAFDRLGKSDLALLDRATVKELGGLTIYPRLPEP